MRQERAEARVGRIIAEELGRLGWQESDLANRRKNDPAKLALAARLRRETTLPLKWITARVRLGTSKSANTKLHLWMRSHPALATAARKKAKIHETTKTNQAMG